MARCRLRRVVCVSTELLFVLHPDENLSLCWQHVSADLLCQSPLLGAQVTFIDCCCFYGEGWGMGCALCPATDSEDYASLCSSYSAAAFPGSFPDSAGPETGPGRGADWLFLQTARSFAALDRLLLFPAAPYSPEFFPAAPLPGRDFSQDYDDYLPAGGSRSGFRARPLSAAEDCGILHGCENGQCIRVAEGYTCDCYAGFELDLTSMSCIDINECEDAAALPFPCVNARCVNTEGSFRCVCRRGYVMSRRRNHCIAA
uniref:Latent-transforming growth factor beta-binding protein 4-like n=1 Tax=Poecilia latipinna TaxID=48699 RepID=A0A3B3UGV4_9TELE